MATGRLTVTGKLSSAPTRSGVITKEITTGFEVPGLDLTGCTKNYAVAITNIPAAAQVQIDLTTGDVVPDGATVADAGVDHEGKDLGAITGVQMVAMVAPVTNPGKVVVAANLFSFTLPPGGFAVIAMPGGLGGGYIEENPVTITVEDVDSAVDFYSWNS